MQRNAADGLFTKSSNFKGIFNSINNNLLIRQLLHIPFFPTKKARLPGQGFLIITFTQLEEKPAIYSLDEKNEKFG